ncbi:putative extracellular nuclease [Leptolyngbyaceae cyanobacterium JSC-12]|nr:putative extracellular nuclease [Leptolyngbyaceae cyanobacterium JSC-12]
MPAISLSSPYTQTFDSLLASGSGTWVNDPAADSSTGLAGWYTARTGTGTTIAADTGSNNAGNLYSYGLAGSSDRALGSIGSGNAAAGNFFWGIRLINDTNNIISSLNISYTGEQWRYSGTAAAQTVDFQYQIGATSLTSGTWIDFNPLDFVSPVISGTTGALNGNLASNQTAISSTLSGISLTPGQEIWLRWSDIDHPGSDHGLAIDNFSVSTTATPPPGAGIIVTQSGGSTDVNEQGETTDTYTIALNTVPTAAVNITITADTQTVVSVDGVNFSSSRTLTLTDITPATVTVRAVNDTVQESSPHIGVITHAIASADATYAALTIPNINVNVLDNDVALQLTKISTIQGTGSTATAGTFTIEGIVIGNFPGTTNNGFYVQEEDADADGNPLTSEGIFVNSSVAVNFGDRVRITGTVVENSSSPSFNQAIITPTSTADVAITGTGLQNLVTPTKIMLGTDPGEIPNNQLERYEGMLVTFAQPLTVIETFQLGRFGQIALSSTGIQRTPTDFIDPNDNPASGTNSSGTSNVVAVTAQQTENAQNRIFLDDGFNNSFRFPTPYINRTPGQPETLRTGTTVENLTGVLGFGFNAYRVHRNPYDANDLLNQLYPLNFNYAPRPETPPAVGGGIKVASFNVLNYFTTLSNGANNARGANSPAEFERQQAKIVAAITQLNADVLGLIELENNGSAAISNLVNALNAVAGAGTYAFIADPADYTSLPGGTDAIKVGFIYKPSVVTPVGAAIAPADPAFSSARAPIAQTFQVNSTGAIFTPIINHFKSKSSSAGLPGDADQGDGQGLSNASRKAQAEALLNFVNNIVIPQSGDTDVMLLGDFNAYSEEDPIDILRAGGYTLLETNPSYIFNGQVGSLDHVLVSQSMLNQVVRAQTWNINSLEPNVLDYNDNVLNPGETSSNPPLNDPTLYRPDPFRSSDHDPVLVGLNLTVAGAGREINGTRNADNLLGTAGDDIIRGNDGNDTIRGNDGNDTIEGGRGGDIIYGGFGDDLLAADRIDRFDDFDGRVSELYGEAGNDTLLGGGKNDLLDGGFGNDVLDGKAGHDTLNGGAGNDTLFGSLGNDTLNGGVGIDTVDYSDLVFNGVFGAIAGLDINLAAGITKHSSTNNSLGSTDVLIGIENIIGTSRNDRFIGDANDNVINGGGQVGRSDRRTTFTDLDGDVYTVIADVVEYSGNRADFQILPGGSASNFRITGSGIGTDTLLNIEFLKFNDGLITTSSLFTTP